MLADTRPPCPKMNGWRDLPRFAAYLQHQAKITGREFDPINGMAASGLFQSTAKWDLTHPRPDPTPADWDIAPIHHRNTGPTRAILTPQSTKFALRQDDEAREHIRTLNKLHGELHNAAIAATSERLRHHFLDRATQDVKPEFTFIYQILDYLLAHEKPTFLELQAFANEADVPFSPDPTKFETEAAARQQLFAELATFGHEVNAARQLQILNTACKSLPFINAR